MTGTEVVTYALRELDAILGSDDGSSTARVSNIR
jgi:hypothetical protein